MTSSTGRSTAADAQESDYAKYRGKCKTMSEAAVAADPTLTLVRGHYICPLWGEQTHWWTMRPDGTIFDPTKDQFPSKGVGVYIPFDGNVDCEHCGETVTEAAAIFIGRHAYCSNECVMAEVL